MFSIAGRATGASFLTAGAAAATAANKAVIKEACIVGSIEEASVRVIKRRLSCAELI
jgi:hypothetical protein